MFSRRGLLLGLGAAVAAPAIVHAGNLMPIKPKKVLWHKPGIYIPEIEIVKTTVTAKARKLSATYTMEIPQEPEHYFSAEALRLLK